MTDAHVHPADLVRVFPEAETERRALNIACAASAWSAAECGRNEALAGAAAAGGAAPVFCCCAIHPQLPLALKTGSAPLPGSFSFSIEAELEALERKAAEGRLAAIGETGFDFYDAAYRETGAEQEKLFAAQLEIAARYGLPLVLHVRRAIHAVFAGTARLKKIPAVVFHSWPGTSDEGFSLLRRGVNAFFSFGTALLLNHRKALRSCALFPADRLLVETDAPYQSPRFRDYSSYRDGKAVLRAMAGLRAAGAHNANDEAELETIVDGNFYRVFAGR
ncbi:MAG: TatD family hydrolase [Treponema sp.]|jgi:TatD DNase family protein|nr:TatD family hydrolase [Treponema sp.]